MCATPLAVGSNGQGTLVDTDGIRLLTDLWRSGFTNVIHRSEAEVTRAHSTGLTLQSTLYFGVSLVICTCMMWTDELCNVCSQFTART